MGGAVGIIRRDFLEEIYKCLGAVVEIWGGQRPRQEKESFEKRWRQTVPVGKVESSILRQQIQGHGCIPTNVVAFACALDNADLYNTDI